MRIIGAFNTTGEVSGPQLPDNQVSQSFVAIDDFLYQIEVITKSPGPDKEVPLQLTLVEEESNSIVATSSATVAIGQQDSFISFEFEPIQNSFEKKYIFTITASESAEPIFPKTSSADYYFRGNMYINGEAQNTDLIFRTYHPLNSYKGKLFDSLASHWQRDPLFLMTYFISILFLIFLLLWQGLKLIKKN